MSLLLRISYSYLKLLSDKNSQKHCGGGGGGSFPPAPPVPTALSCDSFLANYLPSYSLYSQTKVLHPKYYKHLKEDALSTVIMANKNGLISERFACTSSKHLKFLILNFQFTMYFHPKTMLPEDIGQCLECLGWITLQPNVSLALEDGS